MLKYSKTKILFMDEKVTAYISKQKSPQKEILNELRKIIMKTFPKIKEDFKLGVPWYGKYYLVGLKDHVNIGFAIKGLPEKELALFQGKGKTMRHIEVASVKGMDRKKIVNLLRISAKAK